MSFSLPSIEQIKDIENAEIDYMTDRMSAIQARPGNPEGIEIQRFGNAVCYYSKTMTWAAFNTIKGLRSEDIDVIEPITEFYRARARTPRFEVIPSLVDQSFLRRLSDRGFYQSGFHTSMVSEPQTYADVYSNGVTLLECREDQLELYAAIHCRGTGLSDEGIPYVLQNNKVLYHRPGWKFFIACLDEVPAAAGVMYSKDKKASLTFAATLPQYRNRGLHQSLLRRRIEEAVNNDCKLVISQCSFQSQSHKNMERLGMKIGYVRASWTERAAE